MTTRLEELRRDPEVMLVGDGSTGTLAYYKKGTPFEQRCNTSVERILHINRGGKPSFFDGATYHEEPCERGRPLTYDQVPDITTPGGLKHIYETFGNKLIRHLYRWKVRRNGLSKAILLAMYGVVPDDLTFTINANEPNPYIKVDTVNGTVVTHGLPSGTFESTNRFYG